MIKFIITKYKENHQRRMKNFKTFRLFRFISSLIKAQILENVIIVRRMKFYCIHSAFIFCSYLIILVSLRNHCCNFLKKNKIQAEIFKLLLFNVVDAKKLQSAPSEEGNKRIFLFFFNTRIH